MTTKICSCANLLFVIFAGFLLFSARTRIARARPQQLLHFIKTQRSLASIYFSDLSESFSQMETTRKKELHRAQAIEDKVDWIRPPCPSLLTFNPLLLAGVRVHNCLVNCCGVITCWLRWSWMDGACSCDTMLTRSRKNKTKRRPFVNHFVERTVLFALPASFSFWGICTGRHVAKHLGGDFRADQSKVVHNFAFLKINRTAMRHRIQWSYKRVFRSYFISIVICSHL